MLQRFRVDLSDEFRAQIRRQIRKGDSVFVSRTSNTKTVHLVYVNGKLIRVVWDKLHQLIVTVTEPREGDLQIWNERRSKHVHKLWV